MYRASPTSGLVSGLGEPLGDGQTLRAASSCFAGKLECRSEQACVEQAPPMEQRPSVERTRTVERA